MSQPNFHHQPWDPLYAPALQIDAPPLPIYDDFVTIEKSNNEEEDIIWGHDVGSESHLATHLREIPKLRDLLVELLSSEEIDFNKMKDRKRIVVKRHMGRIVGTTDQVKITDADDVYYANRLNRPNIFTKFARGRESAPTPWLTAILEGGGEHPRYDGIVHTAWTGPPAPSFPHHRLAIDDPEEYTKGVEFWSQDIALTDTNMDTMPGIRLDCPWAASALTYHAMQAITLTDSTWKRLNSSKPNRHHD